MIKLYIFIQFIIVISANDDLKLCDVGHFRTSEAICVKCLDYCSSFNELTDNQKETCSPFCKVTNLPTVSSTTSFPTLSSAVDTSTFATLIPGKTAIIIIIPIILVFIVLVVLGICFRNKIRNRVNQLLHGSPRTTQPVLYSNDRNDDTGVNAERQVLINMDPNNPDLSQGGRPVNLPLIPDGDYVLSDRDHYSVIPDNIPGEDTNAVNESEAGNMGDTYIQHSLVSQEESQEESQASVENTFCSGTYVIKPLHHEENVSKPQENLPSTSNESQDNTVQSNPIPAVLTDLPTDYGELSALIDKLVPQKVGPIVDKSAKQKEIQKLSLNFSKNPSMAPIDMKDDNLEIIQDLNFMEDPSSAIDQQDNDEQSPIIDDNKSEESTHRPSDNEFNSMAPMPIGNDNHLPTAPQYTSMVDSSIVANRRPTNDGTSVMQTIPEGDRESVYTLAPENATTAVHESSNRAEESQSKDETLKKSSEK